MMERKVDFFIAGAQKGGTTALYRTLAHHPGIVQSARKETHFFDDEKLDWSSPNYADFHAQFDWSRPGIRGEATPIYCYWSPSLPRLRTYNPRAKIILLLRHPALRAYSHWRMETARGAETLPFEIAIDSTGRSRVTQAPEGRHRVYSYVERGFYSRQVKLIQMLFPPEQVLYLRTDELWQDTNTVIAKIERFLGVEELPLPPIGYVVPVKPSTTAPLSPAARELLDRLYHFEIKETADLVGLDLSDWLSEHYTEPMRAN